MMDFSRWGLPGFQQFSVWSDKYRNFQEFLGEVLEGDRDLLSQADEPAGAGAIARPAKSDVARGEGLFAVRSDIESILRSPLPSRGRSVLKIESTFSDLAPFFEAGFLFSDEGVVELRSMFIFGRVFVPQGFERTKVPVEFPRSGFAGVLKGRTRPLLAALELQAVKVLQGADAFAISPRPGAVVVLLCSRPHPWQLGVLEKTYQILKGHVG
jgi:hypothetical protein